MFLHPDMSAAMVTDHQHTLIAQADRRRLLRTIRRERNARSDRVRPERPVRENRTAATLAGCGQSVAPAR